MQFYIVYKYFPIFEEPVGILLNCANDTNLYFVYFNY